MKSAQGEAGVPAPRENLPRGLYFICLACLMGVAVIGLYMVDSIFTNPFLRTIGYSLFVVLGAGSMGLTLLRLDEYRQLRRWQQWKCPQCGKKYRFAQFPDVKFWAAENTSRRAGVLLSCAECGVESAFDNNGHVRRR